MIKCVIFDMDGTLADTLPLCIESFRRSIEKLSGKILTDREIIETFGPSEEGVVKKLLPGNYKEGLELYLQYYKELHGIMCPRPFDGIIPLLKWLKSQDISAALFVFTGCAGTDEYTEKVYLSDGGEVEEIEIDVFDRELEIYKSNDGQIRIEYFDGEKERFEIGVSDKKLTVKLTENKEWTDYIGFNKAPGEYRKVRISLPSEMIAKLSAATTNENITITNLSFAESVNLQSNGGSIICDNLGAGKEITLAVKNGDITGSISGAMNEFSITCTIKKGESNLPALKEGGDKSLTARCNNGDINIEFAK